MHGAIFWSSIGSVPEHGSGGERRKPRHMECWLAPLLRCEARHFLSTNSRMMAFSGTQLEVTVGKKAVERVHVGARTGFNDIRARADARIDRAVDFNTNHGFA